MFSGSLHVLVYARALFSQHDRTNSGNGDDKTGEVASWCPIVAFGSEGGQGI
jgi:hypothetical protein